MSLPCSDSIPLKIYMETLLSDITTRTDILINQSSGTLITGNPSYQFPRGFSTFPYLSLLPPDRLHIERAVADKELRPIDEGLAAPDSDNDKPVLLVVYCPDHSQPRDRHWGIRWPTISRSVSATGNYTPSLRCLELFENRGFSTTDRYLINYGPITNSAFLRTSTNIAIIPIGTFSLAQRLELEAISWNVGVVAPDGEFNCQNWIAAVLAVAAARNLIREDIVHDVLTIALQENPSDNPVVQTDYALYL